MNRLKGSFLALALVSGCVPGVRALECRDTPVSLQGYKIRRVRIESPISFFAAATFGFDQLTAELPPQPNQSFDVGKLSEGNRQIADHIRSIASDSDQKVKFILVTGKPEDCDAANHSLDVVYSVFTNVYRPYLSHSFEQRTAEVQRPATTGAEGGTSGRYLIKPFVGYDHSLHGFGGVDASWRTPLSFIRSLQAHSSLSPRSTDDQINAAGSAHLKHEGLEHAEWQLAFHYFDLPAGSAKLKQGTLAAQFVGATQELTQQSIVVRYGGSLAGGHQQAGGIQSGSSVLPNSSLGSAKLFLGVTTRLAHQSFAASYGIQLGSTMNGGGLDFTKHLVDLGYTVRFLEEPKLDAITAPNPGVRKPLDVELHASAGLIQNQGAVPLSERFYGGTQPMNFISGNDWIIPEGATIRSFPQNRLGSVGPTSLLGGTRFYSANVTVAKALWGRPLLPRELSQDPDFPHILSGAIATAQGELTDSYKVRDPAFKTAAAAAASDLATLAKSLEALSTDLDQIATAAGTPSLAAEARSIGGRLKTIRRTADSIQKGNTSEYPVLLHTQLRMLDERLSAFIEHLKSASQESAAAPFEDLRGSIAKSRQDLTSNLESPELQAHLKLAQDKAAADFLPARKVLHSFLYELNIYSIAPVAVFDVARVWPTNTGVRYGVGGGVRLSLVNVNFTVGYAASPTRSPGEPSGAVFAKLDITDLFH